MKDFLNIVMIIGWIMFGISVWLKDDELRVRLGLCGLSLVCLGLQLGR